MAGASEQHTYTLDGSTMRLVAALSQVQDGVSWATQAVLAYQLLGDAYKLLGGEDVLPSPVQELAVQLQQLEKYMSVDLEQHIAWSNGRTPYYLERISGHLDTALDIINSCFANKKTLEWSKKAQREVGHVAAELQATFIEYGFCDNIEAIYDIGEAVQRLENLSRKLTQLEKRASSEEASCSLAELHNVIAHVNGIQQAMTEANIDRIHSKFDDINKRIVALHNNITTTNIKSDSRVFLHYLAAQHLLRKPFVATIFQSEASDTINSHLIHPNTRGWILERFSRWLANSERRAFFISGQHGVGKTALSAAVCKLHTHDVIASHFFDSSAEDSQTNQVNGLIQSLSSDMCRTLPEYLNHLDDEFSGEDLTSRLAVSWKDTYQLLLKGPLQQIYGMGRLTSAQSRRKLIILDGLDQCQQSEWAELKDFLKSFFRDISSCFSLLLTVRTKAFNGTVPYTQDDYEGVQLEDRAWINRHIKDIEIYLSSSLGAILSGEDEGDTPTHARADEMTLQQTIDELLKCSSGNFDYALELMAAFASEMGSSGQFLSSLKKATTPIRQQHGAEFEQKMAEFSSPYRSYRDKEGRSVGVRVMRQSQYLKDKSRVALIRGRHKPT